MAVVVFGDERTAMPALVIRDDISSGNGAGALEAQQAAANAALTGNAASIPSRMVALYRRKMRANRKRLSGVKSRAHFLPVAALKPGRDNGAHRLADSRGDPCPPRASHDPPVWADKSRNGGQLFRPVASGIGGGGLHSG